MTTVIPIRRGVMGKPWSAGEWEFLCQWYGDHHGKPLELTALAHALGRSRVAVCIMARHLGLTEKSGRGRGRKPRAKHATKEARYAAIGAATKEWQRVHGHPRGALGMKHTPEAKAKMRVGQHR